MKELRPMTHKRISRLIGHTISSYRNAPERGELLTALHIFELAGSELAARHNLRALELVKIGREYLQIRKAS